MHGEHGERLGTGLQMCRRPVRGRSSVCVPIGPERAVRQEWEPEDLIEVWTLLEEDQERLRNKLGGGTGWGSRCC